MNKNELINAVSNKMSDACGSLYDYIAEHYYEMRKDELKDVLLEVIFTTYSQFRCGNQFAEAYNEALMDNLNERLSDEE